MFESLLKLLGLGPSVDYAKLVKEGAVILDVRTQGEFAGGHIKGSVNISVDQLSASLQRLPNKQIPIITCCASGVRSASAKSILQRKGYQAYNGGAWRSLQSRLWSLCIPADLSQKSASWGKELQTCYKYRNDPYNFSD